MLEGRPSDGSNARVLRARVILGVLMSWWSVCETVQSAFGVGRFLHLGAKWPSWWTEEKKFS